jgi:hypothetical protein
VAVVSSIDLDTAMALGSLRQRGYEVVAVVVVFDEPALSDWAEPPDWVRLLTEHGIRFHRVEDDETVRRLCSEALTSG